MASDHLKLPHPVPDLSTGFADLLKRFLFDRDATALQPVLDHLRDSGREADAREFEKVVGGYLAARCVPDGMPYWSIWATAVVRPTCALFWFDLYSHKLTADALDAANERAQPSFSGVLTARDRTFSWNEAADSSRDNPQPMTPDPLIVSLFRDLDAEVQRHIEADTDPKDVPSHVRRTARWSTHMQLKYQAQLFNASAPR